MVILRFLIHKGQNWFHVKSEWRKIFWFFHTTAQCGNYGNLFSQKNISWNQHFSKDVGFTKFLSKKHE